MNRDTDGITKPEKFTNADLGRYSDVILLEPMSD